MRQLEHLLKRYNPNQPRVPAGHSDGGQWTSGGGGATSDLVAAQPKPKLPRIEENPKNPAFDSADILDSILRDAGLLALKLPKPVILNAVDDGDINDPPIEPVYPLEYIIGLGSLFRAFGALGNALGDLFGGSTEADTSWTLGDHKSPTKWDNQMRSRGWTNEDITSTIQNGKQYPAPNAVRGKIDPTATATRYEYNGKFVVRDNQTGDILQISKPGNFKPMELPK